MKKIICTILVTMLCITSPGISLAHSGGTDSYGGHHDYRNASGLGSYHYHHGYGPHLHMNGVCPYSVPKSSNTTAAQLKLKELRYYFGSIDGSFGPASKKALKAFQRDYGIVVDGSLGPISKKALGL